MSRRLTIVFAAAEGLLAVAIGIALPLVPLTVLWAAYFGFGVDWLVFWRAALDVWLLGHGVDVTFRLDEVTAAGLGIAGADEPVPVTIALLGGAAITLALAVRAGRRIAETREHVLGGLAALLAVAGAATALTAVSLHDDARPSLVQAALLPALVFGLGMGIGMLRERSERRRPAQPSTPTPAERAVARLADRVEPGVRAALGGVLRAGLGAAALTVAAASVVMALALVTSYAEIVRLYEALHGEVLGGVVVTLAQFALLPNLLIFTVAWLVGPGFALGAGSTVSPLGTTLGPVPALPVLGAVPTGEWGFAFVGLLVPVASAFLVGAAVRRRLLRDAAEGRAVAVRGALPLAAIALGGGVLGGLVLGLLAAASAGAIGPGRLAVVGPDPLLVGAIAALEFTVALAAGLAVGDRRVRGR